MTTKVQRQQTIARLVGEHEVTSQPELIELLAAEGIEATQATVSRDLDDIGAVKVRVPSGNSVLSDWARGQIGFGEMIAGFGLNQWTDPNIRWGEISFNEWEVPLWPMKWVMVMGGVLLVLQGISKMSKDIREIARGN